MAEYPHYGHDPIDMTRLPDVTPEVQETWAWEEIPGPKGSGIARVRRNPNFPTARGEFFWHLSMGEHRSLIVALPVEPHDGVDFAVREWPITWAFRNGATWSWDGDEDLPTLRPSLGATDIWHGWVTAGQLIEV